MPDQSRWSIVYFNRWQHADGLACMERAANLSVTRLAVDDPPDRVWPVMAAADGYQIMSARDELPGAYHATAALLARCPRLLAISADGAGFDTVDVDACTEHGVLVVNQAGGNREAVAEHTLGALLALAQRLVEADRWLRRDRDWTRHQLIGHDIYGKTIGLIGLGHIGSRVAEICTKAFGMTVLAFDPYLSATEISARNAEKADWDELWRNADFVSVHCPRAEDTLGMIGHEAFALAKPGAVFLNTARGGIHDEGALLQALESGPIAGAAIDVWDQEPPPLDHPLLRHPKVLASPHTAGISHESRRAVGVGAARQWQDIVTGARPPRLVNSAAWSRYCDRYRRRFGQMPSACDQ